MQQAKFGKTPKGKRLELIKQSPGFKQGKFENINYTPALRRAPAKELQAKKVMPVHWAKFQLANHAWDEPIIVLLN